MLKTVLRGDGKAEVTDFVRALLVENVRRLYVSVKIAASVYVVVPGDNLFDDFAGLVVRKLLFLFQEVMQVALHQLRDDISVVLCRIHVIQP